MRLPEHITFTGLDHWTDMERVARLSEEYPLEWGLLFSPRRMGMEPRYPDASTVEKIFAQRAAHVKIAAHLCGGYSKDVVAGKNIRVNISTFERFQVNYIPDRRQHQESRDSENGEQVGIADIRAHPHRHGTPFIVQWRTLTFPQSDDVHYLFDKSGGRGMVPPNWPEHPGGDQLVGYAGGLGPHNVREQLLRMRPAGPYWIDMEGKVRDEKDRLDLDKVEAVCREVYRTSLDVE